MLFLRADDLHDEIFNSATWWLMMAAACIFFQDDTVVTTQRVTIFFGDTIRGDKKKCRPVFLMKCVHHGINFITGIVAIDPSACPSFIFNQAMEFVSTVLKQFAYCLFEFG